MIGFKDADGDLFQLESLFISVSDGLTSAKSENFRIEGYDSGGTVVASDTVDMSTSDSSGSISYTDEPEVDFGGTLTFDSDWEAITEIRFVGTDADVGTTNGPSFILDDIDFAAPVTNAAPTVEANTGLTVDEGASANAITTTELNATDADGDTITYEVTSGVSNGVLFVDGSSGGTDDGTRDGESALGTGSFTQADIDSGNLLYSHDGSETTSDGFDFDLKDGNGGSVTGQTFSISVTEAPTVTGITRASSASEITNANSVDFEVGFSENVGGLTTGDFTVTQVSGDVGGSVSTVSGSGSSYTVTVDTITGDGDLRLDVVDDDSITSDSEGVPLGGVGTTGSSDGSYASGESFTIDNTDPGFDSSASASANEGTTGTVLDVEAGDDGTTSPDTNVDYTLGGTDAAGFSIDATGQLSLDSSRDFENPTDADTSNDYELTVTATDDAGNTADQSVTVTITDVNEAPAQPSDNDGAADEIAEAAVNGAAVGIDASTTDPEGDTVTWSLDDDAGGRFAIDGSGAVTLADTTQLDHETATSHTITVNASDGSLSATTEFTVTVTDSDETPVFTSGTSASVSEVAAGGTVVQDIDANVGGSDDEGVSYAITDGNTDSAFAIDTTGQLTVNDASQIDNESSPSRTVTVEASEGTASDTQQITITVTDVDESPSFTSGTTDTIAEDAGNGDPVHDVDADVGGPTDAEVDYAITGGNGAGAFSIDSSTGQIDVADASQFDFEGTNSFSLTIEASEETATNTQAVTVSVTDVEETPSFVSTGSASVSESAPDGTVLKDVNATVGGTNDTGVSYALTGGNADSAFVIDGTGQLTVDRPSKLDNESTPSRTVTVNASEGSANATQELTITVADADESPSFTSGTADSIAEDAQNGDPVHDVEADVGGPSDVEVDYAITGGNDAGAFSIDSSTGQIDVADASQFDHEGTNSFSLTIEASEDTATNTQAVTVSVTDVDEMPVFVGVGAQTVNESDTAGTNVVDIDADLNKTGTTPVDTGVTYAIIDGNAEVAGDGGDAFIIDPNTGQLTINDADDVDRSEQASFTLTINASEGSQNDTQDVTITVIDDVAPTLTSSDPADDSTGHVPGDDLTLTFDEPISFGSGNITLRKNDIGFSDAETFDVTTDAGSGDGNVSISGSELTIDPTSDLEADTEYAIRIAATAINDTAATPNAFAGIGNDDDLDFTTADTKPSFAQATGGTISVSVNEDGTLDLTSALEVSDISASDTLVWSVDSPPDNGTLTGLDGESVTYSSGTTHTLSSGPTYIPDAEFAGPAAADDSFDVRVTDTDTYTATATVEVDVEQVNDAPSVTLGDDQIVNGTTTQQTVDGFATFAPGGGSDEASQRVKDYSLTVASDLDGVLSSVDIDTDGNLTYTANDSAEGTATVGVAVIDDGGTANGGANTSATESFDITVDTRSPTVYSASTTARTLTVTMDEPLSTAAANTPPGENFTVTADGSRINVSDVTISGSSIDLGLNNRISFGETVTLNYTQGTNISEDLATNQLANITDQSVTNTVRRPDRDEDGGGGGGGGGGGADPEPSVTVEPEPETEPETDSGTETTPETGDDAETDESAADDRTDSKSVSVRGVRGGERVRIDLSGTGAESDSPDAEPGEPATTDGTESGEGDGEAGSGDGGDEVGSGDGGDGTDTAPTGPRNVVADGLDIQFAEDGDYDMTVRTRDADTSDTSDTDTGTDADGDSGNGDSGNGGSGSASRPDLSTNSLDDEGRRFARETQQRPVGFIEVDTQFEEEAVETATHRFRVRKSYLESTGADADSVRLYRDEIDNWRTLETRQVSETEEYYGFEAETPGFSVFVIGTSAPVFETATPRLDGFNETTGELEATVTVENIGDKSGVYESVLTADGTTIGTVEREIAAGETVELSAAGVVESTGTMAVRFAGQSLGEVTRGEAAPESSELWLLGLFGLVGGIVALGFLWRRRRTDDEAQ